jgi:hypothetical protein
VCPWPLVPGAQALEYNTLERLLLVTSLSIVLAGMAFEGGISAGAHTTLTVLVVAVLVIAVALFLLKMMWELRSSALATLSARRGGKPRAAGGGGGATAPVAPVVSSWMANPLKASSQAPVDSAVSGRTGSHLVTPSSQASIHAPPPPPGASAAPPIPTSSPLPPPTHGAGPRASPEAAGLVFDGHDPEGPATRQRVGRVHSMASPVCELKY